MSCATRSDIHVDRAATAFTAHIDPGASFVDVDDPAAVPDGATPVDMLGVTRTHAGDDVTFETAIKHHGLTDPVLERLAQRNPTGERQRLTPGRRRASPLKIHRAAADGMACSAPLLPTPCPG